MNGGKEFEGGAVTGESDTRRMSKRGAPLKTKRHVFPLSFSSFFAVCICRWTVHALASYACPTVCSTKKRFLLLSPARGEEDKDET